MTDSVGWYRRVAPLLVRSLAGVPLVTARFYDGVTPVYSASLHGPAPGDEPTVDVRLSSGVVQYLALGENALLYEAHRGAVEVHSWTPTASDSSRCEFARVLVRPRADRGGGFAAATARAVRAALQARGCDGIALCDGAATVAVWVPLADGPSYDLVRAWLHALVSDVVRAGACEASELHVASNAVGHWSALPYSLIGPSGATAVTPVRWDELETIAAALAVDALGARLADDVFAAECARIGAGRIDVRAAVMVSGEGHGAILAAVRAVLADERAHTAAEICSEGIARGLLPATTIPAYVQHGIATLLDRQRDRGEKPEFVVLPDGSYRLNVPVDPYAGFPAPMRDRTALDALIGTLKAAVVRDTPASPDDGPNIGAPFERAVADAFAFLGLDATRLGGEGEPDVVALAPLGSLTYRVAVECKTVAAAKLPGNASFVIEAARLRDSVGATYAVLLGLDFPDQAAIDAELVTHRVALWTLDDLIAVLECQLHHPIRWDDLRPLFAPGRVADAIVTFRAEHLHGAWTRAHLVLQYLVEEGLAYQRSLVVDGQPIPQDAFLTAESLTLLVNQRMAREGMLGRCEVADVRAAVVVVCSEAMQIVSYYSDQFIVQRLGFDRPMRTTVALGPRRK